MARFALLADVLELQALGFERADQPVGPEGSRALAETCRQAVGDLQRLLSALPVDLLNWSDGGSSPPMKLAFEFSSTQAERPVRLRYVSLSEATPVERA